MDAVLEFEIAQRQVAQIGYASVEEIMKGW
jgi:hypothetical protein